MQLICISRGSYGCGKAFAESLARNLGARCIGREELLEKATLSGIAAGKLEMACVKPSGLNERMLLEREHYQAFVLSYLAEAALAGPLVYHGLAGHLLFKGIGHVLRVRVETDPESRIRAVQERLGLSRDKAERYIREVDEDRQRWVRTFYNINWSQSREYDFTLNVEHANVDNVASAFCPITQLPEFRETPVAHQGLQDLLLANRCRVTLARDNRTRNAGFQVQADRGTVSVSYRPQYSKVADAIAPVLATVPGAKQIVCTMAATRILWIQEQFDHRQEGFRHITELAKKWGAAVELLRFQASDTAPMVERGVSAQAGQAPTEAAGGIEDDLPAERPISKLGEGGMEETFTELARLGRAGGRTMCQGTVKNLLSAADPDCSLVVVGDVFMDKGKALRLRLSRELATSITDRLHVNVVQAEELKERYLFTSKQLLLMLGCTAITVLFYLLVFTNQEAVLRFLTHSETETLWRVAAAVSVGLFMPTVAYVSGKAVHIMCKLIHLE